MLVGDSFAESLIHFAEEHDSDLIVVGGARDGFFGGHVIGPVSSALLHSSSIPVALAPRGYAEDPPDTITAVTAAVPDPTPATTTRCRSRSPWPAPPSSPSGWCRWCLRRISPTRTTSSNPRSSQIAAAEENMAVAARALPDSPEIESLVAEGMTLESALKKLNWKDSDLLVVGSSRFAAPKRIFLGSTASRILAGTAAPVIVIPRGE